MFEVLECAENRRRRPRRMLSPGKRIEEIALATVAIYLLATDGSAIFHSIRARAYCDLCQFAFHFVTFFFSLCIYEKWVLKVTTFRAVFKYKLWLKCISGDLNVSSFFILLFFFERKSIQTRMKCVVKMTVNNCTKRMFRSLHPYLLLVHQLKSISDFNKFLEFRVLKFPLSRWWCRR